MPEGPSWPVPEPGKEPGGEQGQVAGEVCGVEARPLGRGRGCDPENLTTGL